jgi:cob(I)alamin adenosyltransferase
VGSIHVVLFIFSHTIQRDGWFQGGRQREEDCREDLESWSRELRIKAQAWEKKVVEEKVVRLESLIDELKSDVGDARNFGSKSQQLANEWQKKAHLLEVSWISLIFWNVSSLLRDRESKVSTLRDKVRLLEGELTKLKSDIVMSGQ